jgi:hypothetical protein
MPRGLKLSGRGAGWLLLLMLVMVVVYLLAPHFYLTRVVFWGESDYKDLEKFPARPIHYGPSVSHLDKLPADGKEEGERGYGYWIDLFDDLATKLDMSAKEPR